MRVIEKNIVEAIEYGFNGKTKNLSMRDRLENENGIIKYYLWNTCLFTLDKTSGKMRIFTSSYSYKYEAMSNTTKSRLNAILWNFGYSTLSRNVMKIFYGSEEIKTDAWYILGNDKKLIEE